MNILLISDNFYPEANAPSIRGFEHSKEWVKLGHRVSVITCAPNFPEGRVHFGYKNHWFKREEIDGIQIFRVKTFITSNSGTFLRTLDYLSFMASSFFFGLFIKRPDIVIGTSPQFLTILSAFLLSKIKRSKFVFELRDLWPDSLTELGVMKENIIFRFLSWLELYLYKKADLIISVTTSFVEVLVARGVKEEKIKVIYNGANLSRVKYLPKSESILSDDILRSKKFIAGYVGTLGMSHGLETIIEAAELLSSYNDIGLVIVGSGSEKRRLLDQKLEKNLNNLFFIEKQHPNDIDKVWAACDVSLVMLRNLIIFKTVIPSKIFESLASETPIIISAPDGEAKKIIERYTLGISCPPENPEELATTILRLRNNHHELNTLRKNCAENKYLFDRTVLAKEMLGFLKKIL